MSELIEIVDRYVELRLNEFIAPVVWRREKNLFKMLVAVVLSQNTSDKNAFKALENLEKQVGTITPQALLELPIEALEELIKPAGMYRQRARNLKALAEAFIQLGLTPERLVEMGPERARELLLSLPGVGKKTADVVLVNLGLPAFPVDTHITRIAKRWGIGEKYDEISRWFMERLPRDKYLDFHLKLIQFGRDVCRARNPKCGQCPIGAKCPSFKSAGRSPVT
ncbi:endonuclease III domain-containing protein [Pyrobaculum aerophilum]|uniref:DNA-(Apurinic or apyrimidinic site) lyase (Endonuclease III, PaNth) n=2 Tax=Pyrobaculum aerophilum TaxID=13773 RepID=Q7LX30_PYRAE|nr:MULTISPECIES: endonuclease III [Pyrobaculum]AAF37269.1 putative DNA glycosylase [Pyrobaculum aerophilum]AAL63095.1 DNA-(apurinic or apyrimidinic site) lyase (endonuclease III, PaNth) [Pyrobaculum aerophilum str. IM2]MCX8135536.1 endonuclease III [Pyrobaculum aerophilum]HII48140.1 endonuclease III [Pyrobaculum aerophilum]